MDSGGTATAGGDEGSRIEPYVWRVAGVVVLGTIMSVLDTTIVNVALEALGRDLHTTIDATQWVVTGYMLSLAAVIPVSGWAAKRFGAKPVYLLSLVLFTLGSVLCGAAQSMDQLIVFRVLQGLGGGMIMPLGQLITATAAGPRRMGRVMSITAVPVMLGPILGPTIGGVLVDAASWRWIFFVNVPIGVVAFVASLRMLPRVERRPTHPLDVRGLLLLASGLPLFTYGLAEVGSTGSFTATAVWAPSLAGLALVAAFVAHAARRPHALLDLALYRRATFATASMAVFCIGAASFGVMVLLPLYWQQVRGASAFDTGLLTAPSGIGMALVMPMVGRMADRFGGGPLALFGCVVTMLAAVPFGLIGAHTSTVGLACALFLRGVGVAFAMMPTMTAAFASLQRSELADATPQINVLQRLGASIGVAVLTVVLQRALSGAHGVEATASAYGDAFWCSVGMAALAIVPCVVLVRAERAARAARDLAEPPDGALEPVEALA
jgi:EmrB/QacA subfamily drug resistance transporter